MKKFFYYFISIASIIFGLLFLVAIIQPMIAYQSDYTLEDNLSQFIIYILPNALVFISGIYILFRLRNSKEIQKILIFVVIIVLLFDITTLVVESYCPSYIRIDSYQKLLTLNFWSSDFFQYLYQYYLSDLCPLMFFAES